MTIKLHYQYLIKIKLLILAIELPIACADLITLSLLDSSTIKKSTILCLCKELG